MRCEGLRTCARAVARIGDIDLIREPEAMIDHVAFGPLRANTHAMFDGVGLGLGGDVAASTETFVALLAAMDGVETPQAIAAAQALFGQVVGPQVPAAGHATADATQWLTETGSFAYLAAYVGPDVACLPA